ncbi:hypothetical protein MNBD_GAMMA26-98 [hydrothermal vent metagenome]|uniref:Uncharacterized protein n=1 Tax=hydrothermal vent metagenome TaxID=652676 RepID=A0A3B1B8S6_9ZZZZ
MIMQYELDREEPPCFIIEESCSSPIARAHPKRDALRLVYENITVNEPLNKQLFSLTPRFFPFIFFYRFQQNTYIHRANSRPTQVKLTVLVCGVVPEKSHLKRF